MNSDNFRQPVKVRTVTKCDMKHSHARVANITSASQEISSIL